MTTPTVEQVRKSRAKRRMVKVRAAKRTDGPKFENNPESWLLEYMPKSFPLPFGQVHRDIISETVYAIERGSKTVHAAPRGTGKSTLVNGLTLWALLTGRSKFPVVLPWADKARKQALRFWVNELCFNAKLYADYTYAVAPFHQCGGISSRLANMTDPSTGETTGAQLQITDGMIVLPNDLGAIGSATINGNPRGLNYKTRSGEVVRPTLCIIDDPQDRKTAKSPSRVQETVEKINADVSGMAGPDAAMPIVMPCTVIAKNDVADTFLNDSDWRSVRVPQIVSWPDGWDDNGSETRKLWAQWNEERLNGQAEKDEGKNALAFYEANKAAMTDGMTVSWEERYDRKRGQPDALYSAMWDYYTMGDAAFSAERQNEPKEGSTSTYELTPQMVIKRVNGYARLTAPDQVEWIVAAADVNYVGINWVILAATRDGVVYCPAYGCFTAGKARLFDPKRQAKQLEAVAIQSGVLAWMNEINRLVVMLGDKPHHVQLAGVDCGDWSDLIIQAVYSVRLPLKTVPVRGTPASKYRTPRDCVQYGDGWHVAKWRAGRVLAINADLYKETAQRSFLAEPGTVGSISLYEPNHKGEHNTLANELCGERLEEHVKTPINDYYKWTHKPGARWDKLDAMTYARALLSVAGLSSSGIVLPRHMQKNRRATIQMVGI